MTQYPLFPPDFPLKGEGFPFSEEVIRDRVCFECRLPFVLKEAAQLLEQNLFPLFPYERGASQFAHREGFSSYFSIRSSLALLCHAMLAALVFSEIQGMSYPGVAQSGRAPALGAGGFAGSNPVTRTIP